MTQNQSNQNTPQNAPVDLQQSEMEFTPGQLATVELILGRKTKLVLEFLVIKELPTQEGTFLLQIQNHALAITGQETSDQMGGIVRVIHKGS